METILKLLLFIHISTGALALICGCVALSVKKGNSVHKRTGKIFFYSMLAVTGSSFIISIVKSNHFLLMIAVFSFYQNYMGNRAVKNKTLSPSNADWLVLGGGAVNTLLMIISGNIILTVFGAISIVIVTRNFTAFVRAKQQPGLPPKAWLKMHIGMMTGTYIATITAFVVVNSGFFDFLNLPHWLPWFTPTMILVPLLIYFTRKYTR